jgi:predicted unusual protein kinase regulating ubiquinone biosynthesis (AarF/ABC1/UbiB family)
MVGHIKPEAWKAMLSLIEGIDRANYQQVAEAMVTVGMTSQKVDSKKLAEHIKNLDEQTATLNPNDRTAVADDINQLMIDLAQIGKSHGIRFPASFTLLMKQFLYFDRYIQLLIPDMDLFSDPRMQF